jgi:tetratricopeptide (TPR) repeat protein
MWCAIDEMRWLEAYQAMIGLESIIGVNALGELGFSIAVVAGKSDAAVDRLIALAGEDDPDELLLVTVDRLSELSNLLERDNEMQLRAKAFEAMFRSNHFGKLKSNMQEAVAEKILSIDTHAGRFDRASELLESINKPSTFTNLLTDLAYAPIWPILEQAAGLNLKKSSAGYVEKTGAQYRKNTEDRDAFQEYAHALFYAGQFEDVVSLVDVKDMAKLAESDAWALNVKAYALDSLGKTAEAEAIFDAIAAIPYDPAVNGWLVSFVINRGYRLVSLGQWQKALDAAELAEKVADESGNEYAKMLIRKTKVCALAGIGRRDEAKVLSDAIFYNRKDAYGTAADAMLCTDDDKRAVTIVLEALADPDHSGAMADNLQRPEFELFYTRSILPSLHDRLRGRPDVNAAFNKVARDIPEAYIPMSAIRRKELIGL